MRTISPPTIVRTRVVFINIINFQQTLNLPQAAFKKYLQFVTLVGYKNSNHEAAPAGI